MTATTLLLSRALLSELEDRWRAMGAPIADCLAPGLSEAEIDAHVAPLGLRLSTEATLWWGWHNGAVDPPGTIYTEHHRMTHAFLIQDLARAVEWYGFMRGVVAEISRDRAAAGMYGEDPDDWWPAHLFPLTSSAGTLTIDCGVEGGLPSPVRHMEPSEICMGPTPPRTPSLGELVARWIDVFDRGIAGYDKTTGRWHFTWDRLAQHERLRPI